MLKYLTKAGSAIRCVHGAALHTGVGWDLVPKDSEPSGNSLDRCSRCRHVLASKPRTLAHVHPLLCGTQNSSMITFIT